MLTGHRVQQVRRNRCMYRIAFPRASRCCVNYLLPPLFLVQRQQLIVSTFPCVHIASHRHRRRGLRKDNGFPASLIFRRQPGSIENERKVNSLQSRKEKRKKIGETLDFPSIYLNTSWIFLQFV